MTLIKLTCHSNLPGATGQPGDVIETTEELAQKLIAYKGAKPIAPPKAAKAEAPELAAGEGEMDLGDAEETADAEQIAAPETAARRRARR